MFGEHETFKAIPDFPEYEVSDHGRVRRCGGRVLRGYTDDGGYRSVYLQGRSLAVHRLVLTAFVGPCPPGMETRHLSGDPGDNRLVNLRWGTPAENNLDTVRHGRHEKANRTHCPRGHELAGGNLVEAQRRRGRRSCLACDKARNWHYHRGLLPDLSSAEFKAMADGHYIESVERAPARV